MLKKAPGRPLLSPLEKCRKMLFIKGTVLILHTPMNRSYHREYISSRPITEIKHDWAPTVVPTEMGCEVGVTILLFGGREPSSIDLSPIKSDFVPIVLFW
jgi:hypothetical protein